MNEISQKVGVRSTTLTKYLRALVHDFKVVERIVPFGEKPVRSKKGLYFIVDNTLAFWFSEVYGKLSSPSREELGSIIGKRFEMLCRQFLCEFLVGRGERLLAAGKWWGTVKVNGSSEQREIDLIVETDRAIYVGECKWTEQKVGQRELNWLKESAKAVASTKKPVKFALFSKTGFETLFDKDALTFDAKQLVQNSKR
jgi:hypothetical protein